MPAPQSFKNHTRYDPPFHFVGVPLLLANLIVTIVITVKRWPHHNFTHIWLIVMALALLVILGVARSSAIRAQNRIIRLEERMRLTALLSPTDAAHIPELTTRQLIALRFASDAELPSLVHKTLTQRLEPKAIKASPSSPGAPTTSASSHKQKRERPLGTPAPD